MEAELDPDIHALPPQAAHGLDTVVLGAQDHFLAASGLLSCFLLHARVPGMAGHAAGPRVLVRGRLLDVEVVEALREPCRPQLEVGEAARETVRESPQRC